MTPSHQTFPIASALAMPPPAAAYVEATNACDADALLACFADQALVNDQLRDYWGLAAIRAWIQREVIDVKLTMKVVAVREHFGDAIVTAEIDGDYDKAGLPVPLVLAFHFALRADRIVRLVILNNRTADSAPEIRSLHDAHQRLLEDGG
jgi:ketosteroid isomerase-like protein